MTVAVKVTLVPAYALVVGVEIPVAVELRVAAQAKAKLSASTEPRPLTRLYPVAVSELVAL